MLTSNKSKKGHIKLLCSVLAVNVFWAIKRVSQTLGCNFGVHCVSGGSFSLVMKAMGWNPSCTPKPMNTSSSCWRTVSQSHLYVEWPMKHLPVRTTPITLICPCFYGFENVVFSYKHFDVLQTQYLILHWIYRIHRKSETYLRPNMWNWY